LVSIEHGTNEINSHFIGLVGWVMNTPSGSVEGLMQGPPAKIEEM